MRACSHSVSCAAPYHKTAATRATAPAVVPPALGVALAQRCARLLPITQRRAHISDVLPAALSRVTRLRAASAAVFRALARACFIASMPAATTRSASASSAVKHAPCLRRCGALARKQNLFGAYQRDAYVARARARYRARAPYNGSALATPSCRARRAARFALRALLCASAVWAYRAAVCAGMVGHALTSPAP